MREKDLKVSRRQLLTGSAIAAGLVVLGPAATGAAASSTTSRVPSGTSAPGTSSADAYLRAFPSSHEAATTDLSGVHAEYEAAVAVFPLTLPRGYVFRTKSLASNPPGEVDVRWRVGSGGAEAFLFWAGAMATAAYAAHNRGDAEGARAHLDSLESGYISNVGRSCVEDYENVFVATAVQPAKNGDFDSLRRTSIAEFLSDPVSREIARNAGDIV
ncbi:hypothetical protein LJR042_002562 [Microbacterium maritypicum]|uniref:hypothetical protein n=2 Tax=Microbacterium TaxID=33882 RepID=UPI00141E59DC|nr:hypothetical protein [Microbacterium liquefaciens]NIG66443.1 hypothetical protein [Microbacterium sp. Be9]